MVASISNHGFDAQRWGVRPYRAPHHTASGVALVGGGCRKTENLRMNNKSETEVGYNRHLGMKYPKQRHD